VKNLHHRSLASVENIFKKEKGRGGWGGVAFNMKERGVQKKKLGGVQGGAPTRGVLKQRVPQRGVNHRKALEKKKKKNKKNFKNHHLVVVQQA